MIASQIVLKMIDESVPMGICDAVIDGTVAELVKTRTFWQC